jgi:O-methyltransferase
MIMEVPNNKEVLEKFLSGQQISENEICTIVNMVPNPLYGWEVNSNSLTMVGWYGIENLRYCLENIISDKIEGDFIETGVWRGGLCIFAKCLFDFYNVDKKVIVADSFQGLPMPNTTTYPSDAGDSHYMDEGLKVSLENVIENFKKFNCLDGNVYFLKGWFKDSLPLLKENKFSIIRLDGDMYESTIDALHNLYANLSIGGYCIIDDYNHLGCRRAVADFRAYHNITEEVIRDRTQPGFLEIAYWRKER